MNLTVFVGLVFFGLLAGPVLYCLLDAIRQPAHAFREAGRNKAAWVALLAIGVLAIFVGLAAAFVYAASVRGEVRQYANRAGASPSSAR